MYNILPYAFVLLWPHKIHCFLIILEFPAMDFNLQNMAILLVLLRKHDILDHEYMDVSLWY